MANKKYGFGCKMCGFDSGLQYDTKEARKKAGISHYNNLHSYEAFAGVAGILKEAV